jgi:hypothetical protein
MSKLQLPSEDRLSPAMRAFARLLPVFLSLSIGPLIGASASMHPALGLFENHGDIGDVHLAGSVEYDPVHESYLVTGGGENMLSGSGYQVTSRSPPTSAGSGPAAMPIARRA